MQHEIEKGTLPFTVAFLCVRIHLFRRCCSRRCRHFLPTLKTFLERKLKYNKQDAT